MLDLILSILGVVASLVTILIAAIQLLRRISRRKVALFLREMTEKLKNIGRKEGLYYVYPEGSIQRVINRARPGSRVIVKEGTYTENIKVNKNVIIESESGPDKTVIQAKDPNIHIFDLVADNVSIIGFTIRGGTGLYTAGICLNANSCIIKNNKIMNNGIGIKLSSSMKSSIYNNEIQGNGEGIQLDNSNENEIFDNVISWNDKNGIVADNSVSNKIIRNKIELNIINGIIFNNCKNNTISKNIINSNANNGILLNNSQGNVLTGNTVGSNRNKGLLLAGSSNNIIYYNNFVKNMKNAEEYAENIWSSPSPMAYSYEGKTYTGHLGNYWSDYKGSDENKDGIGDVSYRVGSEKDSYDNYPLVKTTDNYILSAEGF
ncbi:right-handed parallel beta-helix repeat-containing protein [Candidatus Methanodesulfokora washburnensis]|jgi:parallel beta-helix repeat protein|nr:NosD domain-containing protein [Candidatus Methanodesulfokores washburnensis]